MKEKKTRGRPEGVNKSSMKFGYRYTPEEFREMNEALGKIKSATGKTTSKILYDLLIEASSRRI